MKKLLLPLMILGFAIAMPTLAATYYVADTGTDSGSCTESTPCASINYVVANKLAGGDTIYAKGELIPSSSITLSSSLSGTADNPTSIKNWPGETASIHLINSSNVFNIDGSYFDFQGLNFNNNEIIQENSIVFYINNNSSQINITDCDFRDSIYTVYAGGTNISYLTFSHNSLHDTNGIPLYIYSNSSEIKIFNNYFYNNEMSPVIAVNTANSLYIYNNTFYNNLAAIYSMDGTFDAKNNIIANSIIQAVSIREGDSVTLDYNLYYGNDKIAAVIPTIGDIVYYTDLSSWQAAGYDGFSLESNPSFVSATDLHINSGSPAIDMGMDLSASLTIDNDNEPRPFGDNFDIGADELPELMVVAGPSPTSITANAITISWLDSNSYVTSYSVKYSTNPDMSGATTIDGITAQEYEIIGLSGNSIYYIEVKAVYISEHATYESSYSSAISLVTLPNIPNSLKAKKIKSKSALLKWSGSADYYNLKLYKGKKHKKTFTHITALKKKVKSKYLKANTKYKFKVRACNITGCSAFSSFKKFRTKI